MGYVGMEYGCASSILILILILKSDPDLGLRACNSKLKADRERENRTEKRKRTFSKSALNPTACCPNLKSEAMATQSFPVMAITLPPFISIGEPIVSVLVSWL